MSLSNITDVYMPDPGTVEGPIYCGVCGTKMEVERNLYGPTQYLMAVSGTGRAHDRFTCPYREVEWHQQVVRLRHEQRVTASQAITKILEEEIKDILLTRTPSK